MEGLLYLPQDFVFGLSESIHGSMDAKLRSLFRIFDVERDGVVTREVDITISYFVYPK